MAVNKTTFTDQDVQKFIDNVDNEQKRKDSLHLVRLMEKISREKARMYGPTIIGFGEYHYKYASGHGGSAPLLGFSPRKAAISLYVSISCELQQDILSELGKYTMGKACIYVKKLSDIHEEALIRLMKSTIAFISEKYTIVSS